MSDASDPNRLTHSDGDQDIAIVGMAVRLPGAQDIGQYWEMLRDGRCAIREMDAEALQAAGEAPGLIARPDYVPFAAPLDHFADFDAEFFGFSPKEAAILDPQHRQFLETAWEALETAGHVPERFDGPIGVYAGCGMGSYFYFNLCSNRDLVDETGMFLLRHTGNDKDFLATRLSHILDLTGPSLSLQTACSTSLVATHYAAQALLNGECDMALAGGVTIELPQGRGYLYKEGEILSPDGQCHAFDHRAQGTVFGSGVGVVVLRRLADALADGDHIWAVLKGSAVNNDGAAKAGYLAPSVEGQAEAIADAQAMAGVNADGIDYVECHGTGTYLGDPIEVAALTEAFRETTDRHGFCRIGSVKTNIGHLDTAAGVASLAKAALALHHEAMPPSLGYEKPNPAIDFESSPFRVNDTLTSWPRHARPRLAGVNSLGVGGTNAHVILEEAPQVVSEESDWPVQILTVTGRTKAALQENAQRLATWLQDNPEADLADVAFTLQEGRRHFEHRMVTVAEDAREAAETLLSADPRRVLTHTALEATPEVVFMFPGGGAQYADMARDLYETEPDFAEIIDRGLAHLATLSDVDMRALWLPDVQNRAAADEKLTQPSLQLPLTMIVEYALAQLWMSWGVTPSALIGHSMGENAAAAVAEVLSFEDAIGLVHKRGVLFDSVTRGGMLSVAMSAADLRAILPETLDLGAENAPGLSVVSGPADALEYFETELRTREIECQRIAIDIAAHSRLLDPILAEFEAHLRTLDLQPPQIPIVSNRTGQPLTAQEATDPAYWTAHLRGMVRFSDGIDHLATTGAAPRVFLEVGPGKALASLARMHPRLPANQVLGTLRHAEDDIADDAHFLLSLGRLSVLGVAIDWDQIWTDRARRRLPLPTYAFQHQTYFIAPSETQTASEPEWLARRDDIADWGSRIVWTPAAAACEFDVTGDLSEAPQETWLLFEDDAGLGAALRDRLEAAGQTVISVRPGDAFVRLSDTSYLLAPEQGRDGYDMLVRDLGARGLVPTRVVHMWLMTPDERHRPGSSFLHRMQEQGLYSLLFLTQAWEEEGSGTPLHITAVTNGAVQVRGDGLAAPSKATLLGPLQVIPHELSHLTTARLDVVLPEAPAKPLFGAAPKPDLGPLTESLLEEVLAPPRRYDAALRGARRFERQVREVALPETSSDTLVRKDGCYLITGGFDGIGLSLAERLIDQGAGDIVLLSRAGLPDRAHWARHLADHGPGHRMSRRIRAVQALEAHGGRVHVIAADVCNANAMAEAKALIEAEIGPIHGVIHAAGVIDDAPLLAKRSAGIEDVLTPKLHGTLVLDALFPDGALEWMVLCASTSTVTAPAGQVDYVAANAFLNAFAESLAGGKTRVLAINWGLWTEVGMAAEAVARRTGHKEPAPRVPVEQPLLDVASFDADNARIFEATWRASALWVLDEHRLRAENAALLPGTGFVELVAEALQAQGETGPFTLQDLTFLRPLHVADDDAVDVRVTLTRSPQGYGVTVRSAVDHNGRRGWQLHAEGDVVLGGQTAPVAPDFPALAARIGLPETTDLPLRSAQEAHLAFGPRWSVLRGKSTLGHGLTGEGLARLKAADVATEDSAYLLHPALVDIATGWAMELIAGYEAQALWVPMRYGTIRVHRPLTPEVISWVRAASDNHADEATTAFDITLMDPDGGVLLEIENFTLRRMEMALRLADAPRPSEAELTFDEADVTAPLSPAEERLRHNLTQGIRPDEGGEAFLRALARPEPQLVVSSLPIADLIRQADIQEAGAASGASFERPDLETDFAAPETEIEATLAGFWSDLLGVSNVGIDDNFFDLGGHSLIAVRLFNMVRKSYHVDFPISVLFEAPTIRTCAALIAERTGQSGAAPEAGERPEAERPRFTHLVPMHEGEGGPKPPFFLVAGMFGNVLNLRHLAHLMGHDRPFYGLQAKGLYGGEAPHSSIAEAARDYITEMRAVQPHGPYHVGGFSGGGITAYEIAQQLEAAGEEVAIVVLLDTPLPVRRPLKTADRVVMKLADFRREGPLYPFKWLRNRVAWELAKRSGTAESTGEAFAFHNAEIEAAFIAAVEAYEVQPWSGNLQLFRPPLVGHWTVTGGQLVNSERAYLFEDNDWGQYAPQVAVTEVPGDHDSMVLEPHVRVLAQALRHALEDCAPDPAPSEAHRAKAAE